MSQKINAVVTNPHDQFFRKAMEDKRVAIEFLKLYLPADLCAQIDFNVLSLQPRAHANAVRKESIVDVLFKTTLHTKEAYIYLLLEHQSSPDPLMSLRVMEYTMNVIREHVNIHKTSTIPLIYPLVVYHGKPYEFTTDIKALVDAPRELVDRYFLQPFQLLDLSKISDELLQEHLWSGIMTFALKHIFEQDMLLVLQQFAPLLQEVIRENGQDFIGVVLQYIAEKAELNDEHAFIELINANISDKTGEQIMTLAEQWLHKGKQEGMLEGKQEGILEGKQEGILEGKLEIAQEMLVQGLDIHLITKLTHLPIEKISALKKH
jgi:predicted transposase/invertase (TIGR01784 family)